MAYVDQEINFSSSSIASRSNIQCGLHSLHVPSYETGQAVSNFHLWNQDNGKNFDDCSSDDVPDTEFEQKFQDTPGYALMVEDINQSEEA